jgi:hypothetical protein
MGGELSMTKKEFLNRVAHSRGDFLQEFLDTLKRRRVRYCVIGGLAVNAYAEPVVSLDLDVVIVGEKLEELLSELKKHYAVKRQPDSINVEDRRSDLRIQIQTDSRYQKFIRTAVRKSVLGYRVHVASIENVLQGKVWAAMDGTRRPSKRQKDLADIVRLVEADRKLLRHLPVPLKEKIFP